MSDAPKPGDRECRSLGIEGSVAETASSASPALPMVEGQAEWVLVPKHPTHAMKQRGSNALKAVTAGSYDFAHEVWDQMLAAAPPAEPRADDGEVSPVLTSRECTGGEAEGRAAALGLAQRALEYVGWFDGTFGPAEALDADAEIRDRALAVYRALGEPEPVRVMRTRGKRP